jgi:hypothetical protein
MTDPNISALFEFINNPANKIIGIIYDLEGGLSGDAGATWSKNLITTYNAKVGHKPIWHVACALCGFNGCVSAKGCGDKTQTDTTNLKFDSSLKGFTHIAPMMYYGSSSYAIPANAPDGSHPGQPNYINNVISVCTDILSWPQNKIFLTYQSLSLCNSKGVIGDSDLFRKMDEAKKYAGILGWGSQSLKINTCAANYLNPIKPSDTYTCKNCIQSSNSYCGTSWADANSKCKTICGKDADCPGEKCFASCTGCPNPK